MTVITKSLSEKKSDNLEEPLVENIVVEHADEGKKIDIEAGAGYPIPPPHTTRYIISARVRPYYSLMFILMLVLLVATSLLGIFGTEYLYEQYKYFVGSEQKPDIYRAWGTLSYEDDPNAMAYENRVPAQFSRNDDPIDSSILSRFRKLVETVMKQDLEKDDLLFRPDAESTLNSAEEKQSNKYNNELKEKFVLDVDKNYEKIDVPAKGTNRFVHDFYSNFTAIVDLDNQRCFVMPLDRSAILPPKSLYDLIFKMSDGYYSLDTEKIRHDMRVGDRIVDTDSLGVYINKECENFAIYKLEKIVGGVVKRSAQESRVFTYFAGKNIMEINIENLPSSLPRAIP